ncbi:AAA family ATPase [Curtobacterium herbarum]|uniref:AAA family ATPase n=1 Tax=Curtobacterium herbarum TaxID=150122 RepID=A0ABP4K442_9MICO|nr:AAA family ATPase [Curtobacterium herbarum]MBM7474217.1 glucokinase [Curtobacterium herbarum]MCS6546039.1 ATP-binding protein [Curtobacterium herbarum]
MAQVAIIVNGMPGSGKSTVGAALAEVLGCPFLSKDRVKEPLADIAGPTIPSAVLGGIAMDTVWSMAGAVENGVVVDAVLLPSRDRDFLEAGLTTAGSPRVVEVWCDVDRANAEARLRERYEPGTLPIRHDVHGDLAAILAFWDEHEATAGPVGVGPVVRVQTDRPYDVGGLVQEIAAHFG